MSILLDAVTKSKEEHDYTTINPYNFTSSTKNYKLRISVVLLLICLAIAAAYALSYVLTQKIQNFSNKNNLIEQIPVQKKVIQKTNPEPVQNQLELLADKKIESITVADKVTLLQPIAKPKDIENLTATMPISQEPDDVDPQLISAFKNALNEVEYNKSIQSGEKPITDYPKFGSLPIALQKEIPSFNINAIIYATTASKRWLSVDGQELQEGDTIQDKLKIIEIRPSDVVLEIKGTKFSQQMY